MTKDLSKFYDEYVSIIDENLTEYRDDEGNYSLLPTSALLVAVDYNELNKQQYSIAVFNQDIPKNFETKIEKSKKVVSKYELTHNEKDKYTLVEKEEDVHKVWFVINQLKLKKAFNKKEEALEYAEEINKKILNVIRKV
jgi:hypothetical protein